MDREQKRRLRRNSMLGTALFGFALIAAIAFAVTGSIWLIAGAVVFLVAGVVLLYRVGKSLP